MKDELTFAIGLYPRPHVPVLIPSDIPIVTILPVNLDGNTYSVVLSEIFSRRRRGSSQIFLCPLGDSAALFRAVYEKFPDNSNIRESKSS